MPDSFDVSNLPEKTAVRQAGRGDGTAIRARMGCRPNRNGRPAMASVKGGLVAAALAILCTGCTSWQEYLHNGFQVGPNYRPPCTATAEHWIDSGNPHVNNTAPNDAAWWQTLNDPVLNALITSAYRQNLTLRVAGWRIMEARAQRNIAAGNLFPQTQQATGGYTRTNMSPNTPAIAAPFNYDQWQVGTNLAWELDFWGRFRRAIQAADATVDASVENYDDVLVLLVSDVAQR